MKMKTALLGMIAALPFERIQVPELGQGEELRVSVMSGAERDDFDSAWRDMSKKEGAAGKGFRALLALFTLRDVESGERIFGPEDLETVNQLPGTLLDRASKVAMRINRLAADAVEEAEKNS